MFSRIVVASATIVSCLMPSLALAQSKPTLTEEQRREAIKMAFGLGCAVQDHATDRAFAWEGAAMGDAAAMQTKSLELAVQFSGTIYSTEQWAIKNGGFKCDDFPNPNQSAPIVP